MTLKDKAKTYNFWISLVSAAVLIVRIIGDKFNIFIDTTLIMDITTGLCSIFVILGILSAPKSSATNKSIKSISEDQAVENEKPNSITFQEGSEAAQENNEEATQETSSNEEKLEPFIDTATLALNSNDENVEFENNFTDKSLSINRNSTTLIEIIEQLKAEIEKANKVVEDFSNFD